MWVNNRGIRGKCAQHRKNVPETRIPGEIQALKLRLSLQTEGETHFAPLVQYPG